MATEIYPYCEHNRMGDSCEDCAYLRAQEAGLPVPPVTPAQTRAMAEKRAEESAAAVEQQPVVGSRGGARRK